MIAPCYGPSNPSPKDVAASGVRRYVQLVELRPEQEARYREMHAAVWPEVQAAIRRANIRNYSISMATLFGHRVLVSYFEYTGADPVRDFASIADDPTTRDKWWPITDAQQIRLTDTPDGQQWLPAEVVMWLA